MKGNFKKELTGCGNMGEKQGMKALIFLSISVNMIEDVQAEAGNPLDEDTIKKMQAIPGENQEER